MRISDLTGSRRMRCTHFMFLCFIRSAWKKKRSKKIQIRQNHLGAAKANEEVSGVFSYYHGLSHWRDLEGDMHGCSAFPIKHLMRLLAQTSATFTATSHCLMKLIKWCLETANVDPHRRQFVLRLSQHKNRDWWGNSLGSVYEGKCLQYYWEQWCTVLNCHN